MKKLVEEWLRYAENDLRTISKIIDDEHLTNVVTFHSHQCIEKSFKAIILLKTDSLPKVHNLIKLPGYALDCRTPRI